MHLKHAFLFRTHVINVGFVCLGHEGAYKWAFRLGSASLLATATTALPLTSATVLRFPFTNKHLKGNLPYSLLKSNLQAPRGIFKMKTPPG